MTAIAQGRAQTAPLSGSPIPTGISYPIADNVLVWAGTIAVSDATGNVLMGSTGTGLICLGWFQSSYDNTVAGHTAAAFNVPVRQGVAPWNIDTGDPITKANRGALCYIKDNQTISLTDGSGTRSIAGIIVDVDTANSQVYVQMGVYIAQASVSVGGALLTAGIQTNTGAKTFADNTLLVANSGGTFPSTLHSAATAARSFTFPDIANATAIVDAGTQTITGVKTFASGADPVFAKEADHTASVVATTTVATAGGALTIAAGSSGTSGTGGALAVKGGAGDTTGAGGAAALTGGAGGSVSGTGGAATVTAGAGTAGNAAGGVSSMVGGAGNGSGAGGVSKITGGAGGATGTGGAAQVVGGAGGTAAAGGALALTGGAGTTTGAGGAIVAAGGAGGNDAVGGLVSFTGGAAGGGNRAGGAASVVGGAGAGSAAGGASMHTGGVGGTTGAGGAASLTGGAGGASSGTGGAIAIAGGAGSAGNANGGAVTIDGGAKNGSGTDGIVTLCGSNGLGVAIAKPLGWGTAQALSGAGAVNVTSAVTMFTSTGGAQALTLANGTITGQIKIVHHTVDGGSGVLTPASAGNFATFTFTNVHDMCALMWNTASWDILWNVGGTVA